MEKHSPLTRHKRGEEEEKDAAREQGSGPPEERVGKDTGEKINIIIIIMASSSSARDASARVFSLFFFSLLKVFLGEKTRARDRGLKNC